MPWIWKPDFMTFLVPPAPSTTRIAPVGTYIAAVMFFADENNSVPICIGPRNMTMAVGTPLTPTSPNVTQVELDPGRDFGIWTDDPVNEKFDLGIYFAAHNDGVNTLTLFVTLWNVRKT